MELLTKEEVTLIHQLRGNPFFRQLIETIVAEYDEELGIKKPVVSEEAAE